MKTTMLTSLLSAGLLCISTFLYGQVLISGFGAKSRAIGDANTTIADSWAVFNNIGGLSGAEKGTACFGFSQFFDIEGFNSVAVGIAQPVKYGALGASAFRFGDDLYNEQIYSLGFGNKIGFIRLGLRANYYQVHIAEYGTAGAFFMDFGGIVEVSREVSFGASVSNFTASAFGDMDKTPMPVIMKIGVQYNPTDNVALLADLVKDVEFDPEIKVGIEYWINHKLALRTGINTQPFAGFAGLGLRLSRFDVDYAFSSSQFLGLNHQLSVAFQYQKK